RTNSEMNHSYFGMPNAAGRAIAFSWHYLTGHPEHIQLRVAEDSPAETRRATEIPLTTLPYGQAMQHLWTDSTKGYRYAWAVLRPYMLNSFLVCISTMIGVVLVSSVTAYVFSRYRFTGHRVLFLAILSFMMIP